MRWLRHWPLSTTASSVTLSTAHNSCNTLSSSTFLLLLLSISTSLLKDVIRCLYAIYFRPPTRPIVRSNSPGADAFFFDSCSVGYSHSLWCVPRLFVLRPRRSSQNYAVDYAGLPRRPSSHNCYLSVRYAHSLCYRTLLAGEAFSCMLVVYGFLLGHMTRPKRCAGVLISCFKYVYIEPCAVAP